MPIAPARLDEVLRAPAVQVVPVGRASLGDVIEAQPRYRFSSSGTIVPQTVAAGEALAGPHGAAISGALQGMRQLATESGGQLEGVSFSTSASGYALNDAVDGALEAVGSGGVRLEPLEVADEIEARLPESRRETRGREALSFAGRITYGPDHTRLFNRLVAAPGDTTSGRGQVGRQFATTTAHEIEHIREPLFAQRMAAHAEGVAEYLAQLPGAAEHAAQTMGLAFGPGLVPSAHEANLDAVSAWMHAAGVDPETTAGIGRADELLRRTSITSLPQTLARAIATNQHMAGVDAVDRIAHAIQTTDFTDRDLDRFEALVRSLRQL